MAAPWLDERLVWSEWVGLAAALLFVPRIRGWWGESWTLAWATLALVVAFHWTPTVLASPMHAGYDVGLMVAAAPATMLPRGAAWW